MTFLFFPGVRNVLLLLSRSHLALIHAEVVRELMPHRVSDDFAHALAVFLGARVLWALLVGHIERRACLYNRRLPADRKVAL